MVNKVKGVALIQILLISAVLSVFALYLTKTARNQVMIVHWLKDKAEAQVALHNTETQLLFTLLTHALTKEPNNNIEADDSNIIVNKWNFFNKPFTLNKNVVVKIQDQAGLIHAHYPIPSVLKALISSQGYNSSQVNIIVDNLLDWQDVDNIPRAYGNEGFSAKSFIRNGPIPDLTDIKHIEAIPPELYNILSKNLTIYRRGSFNPMTSSLALIAALSNKNVAKQIIKMRNENTLSKNAFIELTGIKEEAGIYMYPSNYFEISLKSTVGESVAEKDFIIKLNPLASDHHTPINIYSSRG